MQVLCTVPILAISGSWSGTKPLIPFGGSLCGQACHPKLGRSLFDAFHFSYAFGVAALLADEGPGKIKTCPSLQDREFAILTRSAS